MGGVRVKQPGPEPAVGRTAWKAAKVVAATLFACGLLYAYGAVSELSWRLELQHNGVPANATVTGHVDGVLLRAPVVTYRDLRGAWIERTAKESFLRGWAPPLNARVQVIYHPDNPSRLHLIANRRAPQFEWYAIPASLAFLFLLMLLLGFRFLLV